MKKLIIGITTITLTLAGITGIALMPSADASTIANGSLTESAVYAAANGFNQYATDNGYTMKEILTAYKEGRKPCNLDCEHQILLKERAEAAHKQALKRLAEQKAAAEKKAAEEAAAKKAAEEAASKQAAEQKASEEKKAAEQQAAAAQQASQASNSSSQQAAAPAQQQSAPVQQQSAPAPAPAPAAPSIPNHPVARAATSSTNGTAGCQGAIDMGGLVDCYFAGYYHYFAGHNNTESWILNLNVGNDVMVGGQMYRVIGIQVFSYNGQNVAYGQTNNKSQYALQTCEFGTDNVRIVYIQRI